MLARCYNPKNKRYKDWGGRGITVCDRWRFGEDGKSGFECFLEDMGSKPHPRLTLERRNVNGNYEPSNCYWAPWEIQDNNKRTSVFLTIAGEMRTTAQWNRKLGWPEGKLGHRVYAIRHLDARIRGSDPASIPALVSVLAKKLTAILDDLGSHG